MTDLIERFRTWAEYQWMKNGKVDVPTLSTPRGRWRIAGFAFGLFVLSVSIAIISAVVVAAFMRSPSVMLSMASILLYVLAVFLWVETEWGSISR